MEANRGPGGRRVQRMRRPVRNDSDDEARGFIILLKTIFHRKKVLSNFCYAERLFRAQLRIASHQTCRWQMAFIFTF